MAEIIDLEKDLSFDDCETCNEPTKYAWGRTFDIYGPGTIGTIYKCENRRCQAKQNRIASYLIRKGI